MKLILVRHGETDDNKNMIVGGQRDTPLNENGIRQAKELAPKLKDIKIDVVYASPLVRALGTAKEIMKFHKGVSLHISDQLKEIDAGEMEGRIGKSLEDCGRMGFGPTKNGEGIEHFQKRVSEFTRQVIAEHGNETVLFVVHAGVIAALLNSLEHKPASEIRKIKVAGNGEFKVLEFDSKLEVGYGTCR